MCSSHLFVLRQLGICRPLCRGSSSPGDLQYPGYYLKVDRDMIRFTYPSLSKGLLVLGSMVRFPFHKGYCGKPAHHTGVSTLSWLLYGYLLNPQPAAPGQDALGLTTLYPRPDEPISDPLQPYQPQPLYPTAFQSGRCPSPSAVRSLFLSSLIVPY